MFGNVLEWKDALYIGAKTELGYKLCNTSKTGIEIISEDEMVTYIPPRNYCYAPKQTVIATLKAYGGRCLNAHMENDKLVLEAAV